MAIKKQVRNRKVVDCKTHILWRLSVIHERKVWSECIYREWDWGETLARIHVSGASRLLSDKREN